MLTQCGALLRIPRQQPGTGSGDRAQKDVSWQRLQVAEQLLTLIACPYRAVLRAPSRAAYAPTAKQLPTTTAASPDLAFGATFLHALDGRVQSGPRRAHFSVPRSAGGREHEREPTPDGWRCLRSLPPTAAASASDLPLSSPRNAGKSRIDGTAPVAFRPDASWRMPSVDRTCRQESPT